MTARPLKILTHPLLTVAGLAFLAPALLMLLTGALHFGLRLPVVTAVDLMTELRAQNSPSYQFGAASIMLGPLVTLLVVGLPAFAQPSSISLEASFEAGQVRASISYTGPWLRLFVVLLCVGLLGLFFAKTLID